MVSVYTKKGVDMLVSIGGGDVKVKVTSQHYISMPMQLYADLCKYVDYYATEVSGCGLVERIEHRTKVKDKPDEVDVEFRISELYLPGKQDNTGASTEFDESTVADILYSLVTAGKETSHLRLHWHSHANMDTFHSGTDEDNYATLSHGDFLVSLVINKAHKFLGRVDYFSPLRVTLCNVDVYMVVDSKCEPSKQALENIDVLDKYLDSKPKYTGYGYGYDGSLYDSDDYDWNEVKNKKQETLTPMDIKLAHELQIDLKTAKEIKNCDKTSCSICINLNECNEFMFHSEGYGY